MKKGFSVVIIIIVLSIFGAALLGYIGYMSENSKGQDSVKGVSKSKYDNGFSITLNSPATWDFYEYLCKDLEECKKSLTSGKKYSSISGGAVTDHELIVAFSDQWQEYSYIKVFIKPSLVGYQEFTSLNNMQNNEEFVNLTFDGDNGAKIMVEIIPIKLIQASFFENVAEFSSK